MRTLASFGAVVLLFFAFGPGSLPAAPPVPGLAMPEGEATPRADAPRADASAAEKRNWLLARLIVDQNFDADKVRSVEQKLLAMSADQLDILARVYRQKQQQREVASQAVLDEARENLEQAKATRHAVAEDVANLRAARQQQYLNFGVTYGGTNAIGYGYNPFGFGPFGFGPYGAAAFAGRPVGPAFGYAPGFGYPPVYGYGGNAGMGYGLGMGYGPAIGYGAGYGPGLGYVAPYPVYGGIYGGMGAGY